MSLMQQTLGEQRGGESCVGSSDKNTPGCAALVSLGKSSEPLGFLRKEINGPALQSHFPLLLRTAFHDGLPAPSISAPLKVEHFLHEST